ncbi:MAG: Na/Pi cotransporter family protein [Clostridiales bacterium]|jgi:phosphate:Na+ symporter|nr:Na/Pi cotransporter family protein [Clostridiales bacterium]
MEVVKGVLTLLAGCGVFLIGMKMMGDGLESSAGPGMRRLFQKISGNRFSGVGIGAGVTAIIQSSTATTVMTIGLVNAGILSLFQAAAIVMGANIGTTVTGIIISLKSLNISMYMMAFALVGVVMMFFKKDIVRKIGGILSGLGLLFIGLELMGDAMQIPRIEQACSDIFRAIDNPLLLILVGIVFTAVIQSSSAVTGILILLAGQGAISVGSALFIVLGSNIGTCITAIIAAFGASPNAKRTALFHLLFNLIGSLVFLPFLWIFKSPIEWTLLTVFVKPEMQIAWFHVIFNVTTTALLLPFIKPLVRLAEFIIRDKPAEEAEPLKLKYVDERLLHTPPIAMEQVKNEILYMGELAKDNLSKGFDAILTGNLDLKEQIAGTERVINFTNHSIASYLIKLSSLSISSSDESKIGAYHHVISDIERIGDHAENFVEMATKMKGEGIEFSMEATAELMRMYDKAAEMFALSIDIFSHRRFTGLERLSAMEEDVDAMKAEFGVNHITRLNEGSCSVERGSYFFSIIAALERIADHLVNVAFSIKNPIGSQAKGASVKTPSEKPIRQSAAKD